MHHGDPESDRDPRADAAGRERPDGQADSGGGSDTSGGPDSAGGSAGSESLSPSQREYRPAHGATEAGSGRVSQSVLRLTTVGLELAGYVLIVGGIGYWIDLSRQHETPYLGIAGVLLGFALGMFRLIRLAKEIGDQ